MSAPTPRDVAEKGFVRTADVPWLKPPQPEPTWTSEQVEDGPTADDMAAATAPAAETTAEEYAATWGSHRWLREALANRDRAHGASLEGHHLVAGIHRFEAGLALAVDLVRGVHRMAAGVNRCANGLNNIAAAIRPPEPTPPTQQDQDTEEVPDARQQ